jgi:selenocysteine-specific elongation factor
MKSVIIGTAGHIDHGKTALVKALTGIDADRLEEEKRRGITIDLGFAHWETTSPSGEQLRFGFVDVPGHERFVRNMLAGVGGIDLVLLVIAADEGIKPQTREHFDICRLLSIRRGITVLTKSDLVDAETLEVATLEVEEFLRGSFLESSPIIPVSALEGTGIDELKRELARAATDVTARNSTAIARLPIDRVFTMKGFGTVVTGTLIAGTIHKEDELCLFPVGKRVRVRGVQVHGSSADHAVAGQRTALNLSGVDKAELARGMTLAPSNLHASRSIDVQLSLLPLAKPLKNGARVHLHAFTSEVIATVRLLDSNQLPAGGSAYAHFQLNDPVLLVPGDHFIIRQFSPVLTIGGGVVLDATPSKKATARTRLDLLTVLNAGDLKSAVHARVARRAQEGMSTAQLTTETGKTQRELEHVIAQLTASGKLFRHGDLLLDSSVLEQLTGRMKALVSAFHSQNPLVAGASKEWLREQARLSMSVFDAVLGVCTTRTILSVASDLVHLPGRGVLMKDDEAESRKTIEHAFASAGLKVPALKDVLAGLKIDKVRAQKLVTLLLRENILVKLSDELVFHRTALEQLLQVLASRKTKNAKIDVAAFKDLTGVSRKYAIPLLEYLDRQRVTRRVGDERVIL